MVVWIGRFLFSLGGERGGLPLPRPLVVWAWWMGSSGMVIACVVVACPRDDRIWSSVGVMDS